MKIGILQTGRSVDPLSTKHGDFPDMMAALLVQSDFAFQTYAVLDDHFPGGVHECDGWLITGSRHSAYEGLAWMPKLKEFLRATYEADTPIVGICFGHQIIAQALGGKVEKSLLGWVIGPTTYDFNDGSQAVINAWHQDQVTVLPKGATRIATSELCQNAALVYGNRALSYQAHPEFTNAFTKDLLDLRRDQLPENVCDMADRGFETLTPSAQIADQIVQFFRSRIINAAKPT